MINIREGRFWTTLLILGFSAMTISSALSTLRFAWAAQFSNAQTARERLSPSLFEWPVSASAQQALLVLAPSTAPEERIDALQRLLALTPMSSGAWLDLSIARAKSGSPMQQVVAALGLASITGPNEANFMAGRAVFGLPFWESLPPDLRRSLAGDLVGGWSAIDEANHQNLNAIFALASDQTRAEILAALLLSGKQSAPIIAALDLTPVKDADPAKQ